MGTHCWSYLFSRILHLTLCYKRTKTNAQESFKSYIICTRSLSLLDFWFTYSRIIQCFKSIVPFLSRSRCTTRPQTAVFLRFFLPVPISISIPILVYPLWGQSNAYTNEDKAVGKKPELTASVSFAPPMPLSHTWLRIFTSALQF